MTVKPKVHKLFDAGWACWHATNVVGCFGSQREAFVASDRAAREKPEATC